jgi:hypothetical protein
MDSESENAWKSVEKRLGAISIVFLILVGLGGISAGFHFQASNTVAAGIFFGIGTSVLATVVTSIVYNWINTQAHLNSMQAAIKTNVQRVLLDVQRETFLQITAEFPRFIPTSFFQATKP